MILWTNQTEQAFREFEFCGFLRGTREGVAEESWDAPYRWMIEQMSRHLGPPPAPDCSPVWAWLQWQGVKRAKPDLRASCHLAKGEVGVRIEFECPDASVLLSDFELWHYVLNYWYLPESEADGDQFDAKLKHRGLSCCDARPLPDQEYHQRIVRSWERIFDLDWTDDALSWPRPRKSIQATLWEITADQVRDCKRFRAR